MCWNGLHHHVPAVFLIDLDSVGDRIGRVFHVSLVGRHRFLVHQNDAGHRRLARRAVRRRSTVGGYAPPKRAKAQRRSTGRQVQAPKRALLRPIRHGKNLRPSRPSAPLYRRSRHASARTQKPRSVSKRHAAPCRLEARMRDATRRAGARHAGTSGNLQGGSRMAGGRDARAWDAARTSSADADATCNAGAPRDAGIVRRCGCGYRAGLSASWKKRAATRAASAASLA